MRNPSWLALFGMGLLSFLGCIDLTSVNTILPNIQNDFAASLTTLQWVINIVMLALASCMVIAGQLEDIYGRQRLLYIGAAILALSSLGAATSTSIMTLLFFRLLQGIAIAILYTAPVAIVPMLFEPKQQARAIGILVSMNAIGLALGPLLGGIVAKLLTWRWIFFLNIPIIFVSVILCAKTLPTDDRNVATRRKVDWLGLLLLLLALPLLIQALSTGSLLSHTDMLYYLLAFILLGIFFIVERKASNPIIRFDFFSKRAFSLGILANFFLAFFYTSVLFMLPLYLTHIKNNTISEVSFVMLFITGTMALLSPFIDRAISYFSLKWVLVAGFLCFITSATIQTQASAQTPVAIIIFSCILFGIGWACILGPSIIATLSAVSTDFSGAAIGTLGTLHNLGGAIGLSMSIAVYHASTQLGHESINIAVQTALNLPGYQVVMWFLAIILCIPAGSIGIGLR